MKRNQSESEEMHLIHPFFNTGIHYIMYDRIIYTVPLFNTHLTLFIMFRCIISSLLPFLSVAVMAEVQTEFDNEEEQRVTLIVHNLKPPFLDGRVRLSLQTDSVSTVKDLTSDFAQNARKGSNLLKDVREKREMMKMRKRFWELGGSRMGDAMGIAQPVEEEAPSAGGVVGGVKGDAEDGDEDDAVNYKDGSSFAKHMKGKVNEAQSQFAKNKSMAEQREYLPVYAVREDLLNIVRENQITVIVGETGSGELDMSYDAI